MTLTDKLLAPKKKVIVLSFTTSKFHFLKVILRLIGFLQDIYGQEWEEEVVDPSVQPKKKRNSSILNESSNLHSSPKYFFNKKVKYIWDEEANLFTRLRYFFSINF